MRKKSTLLKFQNNSDFKKTLKFPRGKPGHEQKGLGIKMVSHSPGWFMTKFWGKIIFNPEFTTEMNWAQVWGKNMTFSGEKAIIHFADDGALCQKL